jgi:hypothetical protein
LKRCQGQSGIARGWPKGAGTLKTFGNPTDLSSRGKRGSRKIFGACLGGHQIFLEGYVGGRGLVLDHPERKSLKARLLDLPPMGVGVEAVAEDHALALVQDMRSNAGDKIQIIHLLLGRVVLTVPIASLFR